MVAISDEGSRMGVVEWLDIILEWPERQVFSTQGFDENNQQTDIGAAVRNGREILLQAFNWESHKYDWWRNLERKVPDIAKSGFTSAWLPPPTQSIAPEGYLPQNLYSINSSYGSEHLLEALLQKMKQYKVRAMADIVINHRAGTTQGHGGMYNRYDGIPLSWDERAVTSCTGGLGNRSTGDNFHMVPNIDHTQHFVRTDITAWLQWLRNSVGFQDFRFDFARGYSPKYVKEYIEEAKPIFSVGSIGILATTMAHIWNTTKAHWPFPSDHIMEGYAYILTHPGIPTVFYDHVYDLGDSIHDQIVKLIDIRKRQDINSRSSIRILEAQPNLYSAIIGEKVCMKLGDGSWCPTGREWTLAASGHRYAVWQNDAPS
ncbi:hypothetical protein GH714_007012 [Hevea brasiliensis]|uniref:alpha-amylase n=1 Tax=Hevea brasiliensis TaxID=3981 RepID=A0A6A6MD72_HEVBR|nr:hypothetical protein GH714_007012 [Hevea brasiliensis]